MKKILLAVVGLGIALTVAPMFAAWEAHVVNVTARIENALYVHPQSQQFNTVFPQEYLQRGFFVTFSESFSATEQQRVGTIEYMIKQKPKPRIDSDVERLWCHENSPADPGDPNDPYYVRCYPSLCPYLSKTPDGSPQPSNDIGVPAFHDPNATSSIAYGKIYKFGADVGDNWIADLAVPCFRGECAQDWADFVYEHNPNATNPDSYQLDPRLESQIFGCDLWVEVTDIY